MEMMRPIAHYIASSVMTAGSKFSNDSYPHRELTRQIIGACFRVHNARGYGFLEVAYRRALAVELRLAGLSVEQEVPYELTHLGCSIGTYFADLVVESLVLVEVKTGLVLDPVAVPQTLNYLRASRLPLGLVAYFGPRVSLKRVILTWQGHSVRDEPVAE